MFIPLCIHEICVVHAEILVASQMKVVFGWQPPTTAITLRSGGTTILGGTVQYIKQRIF